MHNDIHVLVCLGRSIVVRFGGLRGGPFRLAGAGIRSSIHVTFNIFRVRVVTNDWTWLGELIFAVNSGSCNYIYASSKR